MSAKEKLQELFRLRGELTGYPSVDRVHEKDGKFLEKNPIIPSVGVFNLLQLTSAKYQDALAIDCVDTRLSYGEMIKNAEVISKSFKELGIKKGDIISVACENCWQAVECFWAANRIGATITFLNAYAEIDEIKMYLNTFESPIFINFNKNEEYNKSIKKDTKVRNIITITNEKLNDKENDKYNNKLVGYNDFIRFDDLKSIAEFYKKSIFPIQSGKNNALILYTSGTTGNPKSVLLTNENIVATAMYAKNTTKLGNRVGESVLVCVPFSYPYGFITSTLLSQLCGRTAILCPGMNKDNLGYFYDKKPNIVMGSPAFYELTMKNVDQDLSSVTQGVSGGDFLYEHKAQEIIKFFNDRGSNIKLINGSGNAETCGGNTNAFGKDYPPTCVGSPYLGTRAIVVNPDTLEELKYGQEGMYCVSGKNIFKGYYNDPEGTKKSKFMYKGREYFKTGTNGILHEDGIFELTGRSSRFYIITPSLNKVYLDHVQVITSNLDCIKECAIVKKPNDETRYENKAYVVLKDGYKEDEDTKSYILDKLTKPVILTNGEEAQLKPYEIPASIEFVDSLPRTIGSEKIDYKPFEKMAEDEYKREKEVKVKKLTI